MTNSVHAHILLLQWGAWSMSGGIIPRRMEALSARWQSEVPTEWPEEPEPPSVTPGDDVTMCVVDRIVAGLRQSDVRSYVVILDVYRNGRRYDRSVEDAALIRFAELYRGADKRVTYA